MTKLSVNINKIATLRNARGGNIPNVIQTAIDCEKFGADGITVHPRPDQRHIRYDDVFGLKKVLTKEFNIEGYPDEKFLRLVEEVKPHLVTLVPDPPHVLTSNAGWNTILNKSFLKEIVSRLKSSGMRVSIFIDPDKKMILNAPETGTDCIELYTESYAKQYENNAKEAIKPFIEASITARELNLKLNAGHDLNLQNLAYFSQHMISLEEVSIGHSLISDALFFGLENTIQLYKRELG